MEKNIETITKLYLLHKGQIQVIRSTYAQVQNIHTGCYRVVKCIQEPWCVGYLHWEQDGTLKILPACIPIRMVPCRFIKNNVQNYKLTVIHKNMFMWKLLKAMFWRTSSLDTQNVTLWLTSCWRYKVAYSAKSSTWASVNTRKAYISVSGANPGHSASWPAITPATNVPCPRLSFSVSSFVQFVRSYKISLLSDVSTLLVFKITMWILLQSKLWRQGNRWKW
jgi:hypothetical protein